jgi:hypothetical protein
MSSLLLTKFDKCRRGIQAEIELKKKELEKLTQQNEALVEQNMLIKAFFDLSNIMMGVLPLRHGK